MEHSDFDKVRASVQQQCGSEVMIQLDRGRNKVDIQRGVIKEAYPEIIIITCRYIGIGTCYTDGCKACFFKLGAARH